MDTLKLVKEWTRLCKSMMYCDCCPVGCYLPDGARICPANGTTGEISNIFKAVEKWAAENSPKTLLQDLLEKYPNAALNNQGVPCDICPVDLGLSNHPECEKIGVCNRVECWGRPVDDCKEA